MTKNKVVKENENARRRLSASAIDDAPYERRPSSRGVSVVIVCVVVGAVGARGGITFHQVTVGFRDVASCKRECLKTAHHRTEIQI